MDDGLVRRGRGADARTVALELTEPGLAVMREVRARRSAQLQDFVARLDEAQRSALVGVAEALLYPQVTAPGDSWRVCRLCDFKACVDPCCPVLDAVDDLRNQDES